MADDAPPANTPFLPPAGPRGDSPVVQITQHLLAGLLSGQIAPGTRLPSERQLAEMLGVGRSTVRESLKALNVLGIVDVRLGDGTYLKQDTSGLLPKTIEWGLMLGQPEAHDLVETRRHLEEIIAGLAAERATDEDIAALERHLRAMRTAESDPEFVEADLAFHLALAAITGNSVLSDILSGIRALLRVWIARAITRARGREVTIAEHAAVLAAVRDRSPEQARAAMKAHMDAAGSRLYGSLCEQSGAGDDRNDPAADSGTGGIEHPERAVEKP